MHKVHIVSSLLVAFGLSIFSIGCDPAKSPATNGKPGATGAVKKPTGPGSTTGGGTEVPAAAAGGTTETPAEAKPEADKPAEAAPEEKKAEEPKAEDK